MGKVKVYHFYDIIYRENFYVFVGSPKKMEKKFPRFAPFDSKGRTFYPFDKKWPGVCIWLHKRWDWDILAHEAVHAGNWVLRNKGVGINRRNDEALAYYVQFIIREAMEAIHGEEG